MEIVDTELIQDQEYGSMGEIPVDRVITLKGKLDSIRRSEQGGYEISDKAKMTSHKFMGSVQQIFKNLPKPLEWQFFYTNDLPLLLSTCKEVMMSQFGITGIYCAIYRKEKRGMKTTLRTFCF